MFDVNHKVDSSGWTTSITGKMRSTLGAVFDKRKGLPTVIQELIDNLIKESKAKEQEIMDTIILQKPLNPVVTDTTEYIRPAGDLNFKSATSDVNSKVDLQGSGQLAGEYFSYTVPINTVNSDNTQVANNRSIEGFSQQATWDPSNAAMSRDIVEGLEKDGIRLGLGKKFDTKMKSEESPGVVGKVWNWLTAPQGQK